MPDENKNKLSFQNHHKQLPDPYIKYADFEALTTQVEGPELDHTKSNTLVVWCDDHTEAPDKYQGPNATEHFLGSMQKEEHKIKRVLEERRNYNTATTCHVCKKPLEGDSLCDHCHITGGIRKGSLQCL